MKYEEYAAVNNVYECCVLLDDLEVTSIIRAISDLKEKVEVYEQKVKGAENASAILNWQNERPELFSIYQ